MAKKTQTKSVTKTPAKSPAKLLRKATKRAKVRAVPLPSTGHAKKTTLVRPASKKPRPVNHRTPAKAKALAALKQDDILPKQVTAEQRSECSLETIEHIRARTATPDPRVKPREEPIASGLVSAALDAKATGGPAPMAAVTKVVSAKSFGDLRETTVASRGSITTPGTGTSLGAACQEAGAMPRATRMTFMPLGMMVHQQAVVFGLMMDVLKMQHQFFDMWRPRFR